MTHRLRCDGCGKPEGEVDLTPRGGYLLCPKCRRNDTKFNAKIILIYLLGFGWAAEILVLFSVKP